MQVFRISYVEMKGIGLQESTQCARLACRPTSKLRSTWSETKTDPAGW